MKEIIILYLFQFSSFPPLLYYSSSFFLLLLFPAKMSEKVSQVLLFFKDILIKVGANAFETFRLAIDR